MPEETALSAPVAGPARDEVRRLVRLAAPVIVAYLGTVAMGVVDTMMVGHLGAGALAAVALASTWTFGVMIIALGASRALDPVVSQAHGAGDRRTAGLGLSLGLAMAAILAPAVMMLFSFAEPALRLLGQPKELLGPAGAYCRALIWGVPGLLSFAICRQFMQALGDMRPGTIAVILANGVNAGLNWILIYGKFGLPALGALGSGYATAVSQWFMLGALLVLGRRSFRGHWLGWREPLAWRLLGRLLGLGIPLGFQMGLEVWAFHAAGLMLGWLGAVPMAAHAVAMNLATLAFMIPAGLAAGTSTRVGHLLGAGLPWARTARIALLLGASVMVVPALAFTLAPRLLAGLYTPDAQVVAVAAALLPLAGAFQLFDGVQVVSFGVLRAAGDVHVPSVANIVGYWALGLPAGWLLAFRAGWGPRGVWFGLIVALAAVAAILVLRIAWVARKGGVRIVMEHS